MTDECIMGGNHEYPKDVYGGHCIKCNQSPVSSGGNIMFENIINEMKERMKSCKVNEFQYIVNQAEWEGVLSFMCYMETKLTAIKEALPDEKRIKELASNYDYDYDLVLNHILRSIQKILEEKDE